MGVRCGEFSGIGRLQYVIGVLQVAGGPDDKVSGNVDMEDIVVEVIVKFLFVGEVHMVPAVIVIVYCYAGIGVGQEISRGIDHSFAVALQRGEIMPADIEPDGIMGREGRREPEESPGAVMFLIPARDVAVRFPHSCRYVRRG